MYVLLDSVITFRLINKDYIQTKVALYKIKGKEMNEGMKMTSPSPPIFLSLSVSSHSILLPFSLSFSLVSLRLFISKDPRE